MAESLHAHQIERILELGAWRDAGHRFAVGLHGEVSKYHEEDKEYQDESGQRQGAAASTPPSTSTPPPASTPPAASDPQSGGADRRQTLIERYLGFQPEILLYYPSTHFREVDHGLLITTRIYPLGLAGPCYWICLFLPDNAIFSPKAFAFDRLSPSPRTVGPRHTNFPDGSICAFTDDDDAWRPGDSPKILLNLYAEWLACHLFLRIEKRWPGRQAGLDAAYRQLEFEITEWCDCGSGKRYGVCHRDSDAIEVERLNDSGEYEPLPPRVVPDAIVDFAKTRWKKLPDFGRLPMHRYAGQPPRH